MSFFLLVLVSLFCHLRTQFPTTGKSDTTLFKAQPKPAQCPYQCCIFLTLFKSHKDINLKINMNTNILTPLSENRRKCKYTHLLDSGALYWAWLIFNAGCFIFDLIHTSSTLEYAEYAEYLPIVFLIERPKISESESTINLRTCLGHLVLFDFWPVNYK